MPRLLARHQRRLPPHNLPAQGSSNPHPHRHKSLNPHPQILVRNPQILILIPTNPQILKSSSSNPGRHPQILISRLSLSLCPSPPHHNMDANPILIPIRISLSPLADFPAVFLIFVIVTLIFVMKDKSTNTNTKL